MQQRAWAAMVGVLGLLVGAQALAGATASSFRKETRQGANYWNANSAIDGKLDTAWMVAGASENVGEYITVDLPKSTIDKLGMVVGYAIDEENFQDYARVKSVKVELFQYNFSQQLEPVPGATATATFEDKMGMQVVDITNLEMDSDGGGQVRITITELYPGRDYPNFGISELVVYPTEYDAATTIVSVSDDSDTSNSQFEMTDDNAKTFWLGNAQGASVTFTASGYGLSRVGILPGPKTYARPKKVEIIAQGRSVTYDLPDDAKTQWLEIPPVNGFAGGAWGDIELKVLEVYGTNPKLAIAELDLKASNYTGF